MLGPDEYLLGEEKAAVEVIEGAAPLPRVFPPYQVGPFARRDSSNPTVMNNVETLAHVLALRGDRDIDLSDLSNLLALLVGSWSLAVDLPPAAAALRSLSTEVYAALRDAVLAELPELQRAVHPSPGWRRR